MSRYEGKNFVEDNNKDSSFTNYGFTSHSQPDLYNIRTSGYKRSDAVNLPTANVAHHEAQKDAYYNDYGNCYTPILENLRPKIDNIQRNRGRGVNEAPDLAHPNNHRHNEEQLQELHARRTQHRAEKQGKVVDPITEQLASVEPIQVTFFDRKKGIEYDAYGQVIVTSVLDADAPTNSEFSEDVIQPYSYPPHYDNQLQDRGQPAPTGDYSQPAPEHLQSFQEWYKVYNATGQRGQQPTPPWQTPKKAPKVPNYVVFSIVACFFCIPIGGFALGYVINSSKQRKAGNYQAAIESANTAFKLCIVAVVLGVIGIAVGGFLVWYQIQRINKIISPKTR